MIRLLWKELTYNWWLTLAACGAGLLLMLSGDPVYWSDQLTLKSFWLKLVVMLMGLRAYSSELGGDTMQFLGSRPIRWWQIWIAKLSAGLLQVVVVSVVCGVIYALLAPAEYRQFMAPALVEGIFKGFWLLGLSYVLGFSASVLTPGVPLSFAALVVMGVIVALPSIMLSQIGRSSGSSGLAHFATTMGGNTGLVCAVVAPIGSMVIARRLTSLSSLGRWTICVSFLLIGSVLGGVTAGIWGNIDPSNNKPAGVCMSLSPDGKWAVYGVTKDKRSRTYLIDISTGKRCLELLDPQQLGCSWSPDSSRLAYWVSLGMKVRTVSIRPRPSLGPLVHLPSVPDQKSRTLEGLLVWSPSGDRLAAVRTSRDKKSGEEKYSLALVRPGRDTVETPRPVVLMGMDAMRSAASEWPAPVMPEILFWPDKDGGRLTIGTLASSDSQ